MQTEPVTMCSTEGGSNAGSGEPIHAYYPQVVTEVEWGQAFRRRRKNATAFFLKPRTAPDMNEERNVRETVWRAISMQNVNIRKPYESKLMEGHNIVDRSALSPKQHIKLLAEPKKLMFDTHSKEPVLKHPKACTPRVLQLSIPKRNLVLGTWKDYQNTLPVAKIDRLIGILNADIAMGLPDAEKCFKDLDKDKRRLLRRERRRKLRSERRRQRLEQRWLEGKATVLAAKLTNFLCGSQLRHLNYYEKQLSDEILTQLDATGRLVKPVRTTRSIYKRGLLETSDQCAVFIYSILSFLDNLSVTARSAYDDSEYDLSESDEGSGLYQPAFDAAETIKELSKITSELEGTLIKEYLLGSIQAELMFGQVGGEFIGAAEGFNESTEGFETSELCFMRLLQILNTCYQNKGADQELRVFDDPDLPDVRMYGMIGNIQGIQEMRVEEEPLSKLQRAFNKKITEYVLETAPATLDDEMKEIICFISGVLARQLAEELGWMPGTGKSAFGIEGMGIGEGEIDETYDIGAVGESEYGDVGLEGKEGVEVVEGTEGIEGTEVVEGIEGTEVIEGAEGIEGTEVIEVAEGIEGMEGVEGIEGIEIMDGTSDVTEEGIREGAERVDEGQQEIRDYELGAVPTVELEDFGEAEDTTSFASSIRTICSHRETVVDEELAEPATDISEEMLAEMEAEGIMDASTLDRLHEVIIMPHAPDMVCCASLRAWATWVKDVSENAKNWCLWIHQTIREMREMAAVLRGEVFGDDGEPVILHREQWNDFVVRLDKDIVRWRHYNEHVQDLTEKIISHFHDKRVACCYLCERENLNLSAVGAEHLCEQLVEALDTTQYWRKWLHAMVLEAETLTGLMQERDTATIQEITNSQEMLAIVGQTIMAQQPDTTMVPGTSRGPGSKQPRESVYSIERVSSFEMKKKKKE